MNDTPKHNIYDEYGLKFQWDMEKKNGISWGAVCRFGKHEIWVNQPILFSSMPSVGSEVFIPHQYFRTQPSMDWLVDALIDANTIRIYWNKEAGLKER
jgi:hypothetical protein